MIESAVISNGHIDIPIRIAKNENSEGVILILPAMGVKASYYDPLIESFSQYNYTLISADWRGHGDSIAVPSRRIDFGYQDLIEDIGTIIGYIKNHYPAQKIIMIGHSLGGQLGSLYSSRYPDDIASHVFVASCMVYYKGWSGFGRLKVIVATNLFPLISTLWGSFHGGKLGFAGHESKTVIHDWSRNGRTGMYKLTGSSFDYDEALARLQKPILSFSIDKDDFAPVQAISNLLGKFSSQSNVQKCHVSASDAGVKKLTHFNWVKHNQYIVNQILIWLQN